MAGQKGINNEVIVNDNPNIKAVGVGSMWRHTEEGDVYIMCREGLGNRDHKFCSGTGNTGASMVNLFSLTRGINWSHGVITKDCNALTDRELSVLNCESSGEFERVYSVTINSKGEDKK